MGGVLRGLVTFGLLAFVAFNRGWILAPTPLSAASLTVAVVALEGRDDVLSLVPARDAAIAFLRTNLPAAWSSATQGLGHLIVVTTSPGITIKVIAQRGTTVHRNDTRRSFEDVLMYVQDDTGTLNRSSVTTTALHELGHIWCCNGPGTTDGHWTTPVAEGTGLNRYGLMNTPVQCAGTTAATLVCPNAFSPRELAEMGLRAP